MWSHTLVATFENCQGRPWDVTQPSTHLHNPAHHRFVMASAGSPLSPRRQVLDSQRYFRTGSERRDAGLVSCSLSSLTQAESNAQYCFMSSWVYNRDRKRENNRERLEFTPKLIHQIGVYFVPSISGRLTDLPSLQSGQQWAPWMVCVCLHGPFSLALSQRQAVWVKQSNKKRERE